MDSNTTAIIITSIIAGLVFLFASTACLIIYVVEITKNSVSYQIEQHLKEILYKLKEIKAQTADIDELRVIAEAFDATKGGQK